MLVEVHHPLIYHATLLCIFSVMPRKIINLAYTVLYRCDIGSVNTQTVLNNPNYRPNDPTNTSQALRLIQTKIDTTYLVKT